MSNVLIHFKYVFCKLFLKIYELTYVDESLFDEKAHANLNEIYEYLLEPASLDVE